MKIFDISVPGSPILLILLNIGQPAHFILITSDSMYAFVAIKTGYAVLNLWNPKNPTILKTVTLEELFYLTLLDASSTSELYLLAISSHNIYIIDSEDPANPIVAQKVDLIYQLNEILISPDASKLYVSSMVGMTVLKIIQANPARIAPALNITNYKKTTVLPNPLDIIPTIDGNFFLVSDQYNGIGLYDANQLILLKQFDFGPSFMMTYSQKNPIVYLANNGKLSVLNISTLLNISILSVVDCEGSAFGVVLTKNEDYAFVTNPIRKKIFVVSVAYPNLPQIVANLQGFMGAPTILSISNDDNTLFVTCARVGFSVVDISDKKNPKFISQTKIGNVSSMLYYNKEGSEYLAFTLFSEGRLLVFNVDDPINANTR